MPIRMTATAACSYGTKRLAAGDDFTVAGESEARLYRAMKWAKNADRAEAPAPPPVAKRGTYRTAALEAASAGSQRRPAKPPVGPPPPVIVPAPEPPPETEAAPPAVELAAAEPIAAPPSNPVEPSGTYQRSDLVARDGEA